MPKYKFYINRLTRGHPSLEVSSTKKKWKNMELTTHPTKKGRYISLKENPDPDRPSKAYLRKYARDDPLRTRGDLLKKFNLSEEDLKEIEDYLIQHYKK
ncbi:MAG: hypothetical protein J5511_02845 [Bacilli bacterium]|nr:hypothetical protein [Bacilli bacterium]